MQEVEIEIIGAETREACVARLPDALYGEVVGHFGDQEYAIALTGNHMANQFLGATLIVQFRRVDQRHAERNTCAQRFFLSSCRMSSLCESCRTLTECGYYGAIGELYGSVRGI